MIPRNVLTALQVAATKAHQKGMAQMRANVRSSNNIIRHSAARQLDEPSPQQASAIAKILRLP